MFGTASSTNVLAWNFMMFHPAYAAPARVGTHEASYEAFMVDTNSGAPAGGVTSAPFILTWTVMGPDVQILMADNGSLTARWPSCLTNFGLEHASSPTGSWQTVVDAPVLSNGWWTLALDPDQHEPFVRLMRPPAP